MIGVLLALVLMVGGPALVRCMDGVPSAVACCVEAPAATSTVGIRWAGVEDRSAAPVRPSMTRRIPRWLDRTAGGLPPSRAPDRVFAPSC